MHISTNTQRLVRFTFKYTKIVTITVGDYDLGNRGLRIGELRRYKTLTGKFLFIHIFLKNVWRIRRRRSRIGDRLPLLT